MLKGRSARLLSTVIGATALSITSLNARAEFEMGSYLDAPGGQEIEAGDYDAAIALASGPMWRHDAETELGAATNLCVAYTVKSEFKAAEGACAEALTLARRADKATGARLRGNLSTARALTNRGVLRAVTGDSLSAARDFRAAERLGGEWDAPSRNLAYLESSPEYRVAMTQTAD